MTIWPRATDDALCEEQRTWWSGRRGAITEQNGDKHLCNDTLLGMLRFFIVIQGNRDVSLEISPASL